jgi:PAS domain S-box-containing protein
MTMPDAKTERALLHHGLLAAMRLSTEPMLLTDPHQADNPIIAANDAFERLTQYKEPELLGHNCRLLQGPDTDPQSVRQLGAALRRGEGFVQRLANYRRDGSLFWNVLFVSPVYGRDGELHFFFSNQHELRVGQRATLPFGPAHMSPGQQTEFRLLLLDIAQDVAAAASSDRLASRVHALEAALATAREISALSINLAPGANARRDER